MKITSAQEIYAQLYDACIFDWPGELDFYQQLIAHPSLIDHGVLEIACGTGRITTQLAKEGINITGLDLSSALLEVAKHKSTGLSNIQWIQGDMRNFDLGKKFGYVIMPGHSFQAMNTADEQIAMSRTDQASSDPRWFARHPPGSPGSYLACRITRYEQTCQQE